MGIRSYLNFDKWLLLSVCALLVIGVYMIYSCSEFQAARNGFSSWHYALLHLRSIAAGFVALAFCAVIDHKIFYSIAKPCFLICLVGLLLVAAVGAAAKGASRWLSVGGLSLQPSEFLKIFFFAYLARRLSALGDDITDFKKGFWRPLVMIGIVCVLILFQPNFSMAVMVGVVSYAMLFISGVKVKYLFGAVVPISVIGLIVALSQPYRMKRVVSFLHPEEHLQDGGWQLYNSLVSLGHGGIFGVGIGQGTQKLGFLPENYKDVAFSSLGEELGFVGTSVVLFLFMVIVLRGFKIARNAQSRFSKYFAIGLTLSIAMNVVLHVFVCTGMMPTTGQPLPFISYGGTNLLISLASVGILLNISRAHTGENIFEPRSVAQDSRVLA